MISGRTLSEYKPVWQMPEFPGPWTLCSFISSHSKNEAPRGINLFWSLLKWRTTHCFGGKFPSQMRRCFCLELLHHLVMFLWPAVWLCVTGWARAHFGRSPSVDHIISDQPRLCMIWKFCRDECVLPEVSGAGL